MSAFIPSMWSKHLLEIFKKTSVMDHFESPRLSGQDVWAPTGEDYSEAVAWSHILGISVTRPTGSMKDNLLLRSPGRYVTMIPLCSPTELINVMRDIASTPAGKATIITSAFPPKSKVRNGNV
jgi:hypothetical protein